MKFNLLYTALFLFATFRIIFSEDWTHSGNGENDEEEEEEKTWRERQEARNFQIGISIPWVKTSRQLLSTIPKSLLIPTVQYFNKDPKLKDHFFCRVEVQKGVKIVGQVMNAAATMCFTKHQK